MKCKKCGEELIEGQKFCSNCGKNVADTEPSKNKKKGGKKKFVFIALAVVLVFFIAVASGGGEDSGTITGQNESVVTTAVQETETTEHAETTSVVEYYKSEIKQAAKDKDFEKLNSLSNEIPQEVQAFFCKTTNKLGMEILSTSRTPIIQNNVYTMKEYYDNFAFVDKDFYNKDTPLWDAYSYIGVIADYSEDYNSFVKARNSTSSVGYMDYMIKSRVQSADSSTEYTDDYLIEFYMYGEEAILRTDKNVQKGETAGYLKAVGKHDYTDSSGFEYTYTVYEELTQDEIDAYLLDVQVCDKYYENVTPVVSTQFYRLLEIANAYAKENPVNITEKNFTGKYIELNDLTPAEYKNTLELNDNGIAVLNLNLGEGFEEIRATYTYEDYLNKISVEVKMNALNINSFYFTVEGDKLIYHGEDIGYLSDGIPFVK